METIKLTVHVNSIVQRDDGRTLVIATNGSKTGPPTVIFDVDAEHASSQFVGKRYYVEIEEV